METIELIDLRLCAAIAERASLRSGAAALGISAPAATKRLAALEQRLGTPLFARSTRRITPTAEGAALVSRAQAVLQAVDELQSDLQASRTDDAGSLRVVSSLGFGRRWLGPALAEFSAAHPNIALQLVLRERMPDLAAEGFDAAVWLWTPQAELQGRVSALRLARNKRVLVAAPRYLRRMGTPQALADLAAHRCICVHEHTLKADTWALQHTQGEQASVRVAGALSTNSGELAMDWCLSGAGVLLRSEWDAAPHLKAGRLVHLLPQWAMTDADVHWVTPFRAKQPARVKLLAEHLKAAFANAPWLSR